MKKIALTSLIALFAASAASAGVFDPTYRVKEGDIFGGFGINYTTGFNKTGSSMTDWTAGDWDVDDVNLAYGITDKFALTLDVTRGSLAFNPVSGIVSHGFAYMDVMAGTTNPELGINWRALGGESFNLDVIAKYGFAWTRENMSGNHTRIGMNNVTAGVKLSGTVDKFQWGATALLNYMWIPGWLMNDNLVNLYMQAEAQYAITAKWAARAELNYDIYNLTKEAGPDYLIFDRSVALGAVYAISDTAAVQPYVSYHFGTKSDGSSFFDRFWQIGAKFGVQF
ncbi:MAG: hypothetical protein FWE50_02780 [Alphaproteobacteria bacterium]|nr:hypothetical protein [Alphaproteobacteria bacterium]